MLKRQNYQAWGKGTWQGMEDETNIYSASAEGECILFAWMHLISFSSKNSLIIEVTKIQMLEPRLRDHKSFVWVPRSPRNKSQDFFFNFYWSLVDLQCCVRFRCTAKWISYMYTYIHSFFFFKILFPYRPLQSVERSSLCHLEQGWSNMDGPRGCHTEWTKPDTKRQISYDITYMQNLKKEGTNEQEPRSESGHVWLKSPSTFCCISWPSLHVYPISLFHPPEALEDCWPVLI